MTGQKDLANASCFQLHILLGPSTGVIETL